jgi:HSP20 family protein
MADKQTVAPARQESRVARSDPYGWATSPFNMLGRFGEEIDRMFDDFGFGRRGLRTPRWRESGSQLWAPDIDVFQRGDELVVRADLPGLTKNDVTVDISDDVLTIQGERKSGREEEREGIYHMERSYGSFRRVIPLPEGAITEKAKANFREGVLEVTIPAPPAQAAQGRRLEIGEQTEAEK